VVEETSVRGDSRVPWKRMVTMPLPWKKQLADAHHSTRQALNKVHALETSFEARVAEEKRKREAAEVEAAHFEVRSLVLAGELAAIKANAAQRSEHRPLSDAELVALAAALMTEMLPATPARKAIIDDLTYRGVLPPKEP
jgi:hypothetical protein